MGKLDGSCLCGSVTYTSTDDDPMMVIVCHCNDCQKQSGAAFSTNVAVSSAGFTLSGETVSTYQTTGEESGLPRERKFCNKCGSPIVTLLEEMPDLTVIKAGTLEDRSWLAPQMELWTSRKQGWIETNDELGCFETGMRTE